MHNNSVRGMIIIRIKQLIAFVIGAISAVVGFRLRLFAHDIAWPTSYSYSGPRENTIWAIREQTYQDVGMVILVFGLVVILVVLVNWLFLPPNVNEDSL